MLVGMFPAAVVVSSDIPETDTPPVVEEPRHPEDRATLPEIPEVLPERPEDTAEQLALTEDVSGTCGENLTWTLTTDGTKGEFSDIKSRTCDLARPTVTVTLNSNGQPVISWKAVEGAVKYQVYRSTSENSGYTLLWTGKSTKLTNTSVESGVTYYYKVRAVCAKSAGNGAYSVVKSVTVK